RCACRRWRECVASRIDHCRCTFTFRVAAWLREAGDTGHDNVMIARTTMYVAVLVLLSASATACSDPAAGRSVTRDSSGVMVVESFAEGDARPPFARESFVDLRGEMVIVGDADVLGYREHSTDGMLRRVVAVPTFQLQV